MFQKAYAIASNFTFPVVLSRRTINGKCSSAIGSFVVLNNDGWVITASHIVKMYLEMQAEVDRVSKLKAETVSIQNDTSLSPKEKKKRLHKLPVLPVSLSQNCSAWWGFDGIEIKQFDMLEVMDLAVGKLEPFNQNLVSTYPVFKDPAKNFTQGTSLCKLGFPFYSIQPIWDENTARFQLPPGSVPLPRFPIDGIYTRNRQMVTADGSPFPFPFIFLETSTPGLRGQSGGPIFDREGSIWAIQSQTDHLPLGFDPEVPNSGGKKEHQFLNVGLGAHATTIIEFLKSREIAFQLSEY